MASCGQDNKIKVWFILFADFLGVYSDASSHLSVLTL